MDERVKQILRIAREHYERREYERMEGLLVPIMESLDRFADVHNMLGIAAHDRRELDIAEGYFLRALELNPRYTEASLNLAVTYNEQGRYDLARQIHEKASGSKRPDDDVDPFVIGKIANMHAEVGQAYLDAALIHEAVPEFEKAVNLCPGFADLRYRLGVIHRELGDADRARKQFEAARQVNPKYAPARIALAVAMIAEGERKAAENELEDVLAFDPDHKMAQMYLRMLRGILPPGAK